MTANEKTSKLYEGLLDEERLFLLKKDLESFEKSQDEFFKDHFEWFFNKYNLGLMGIFFRKSIKKALREFYNAGFDAGAEAELIKIKRPQRYSFTKVSIDNENDSREV